MDNNLLKNNGNEHEMEEADNIVFNDANDRKDREEGLEENEEDDSLHIKDSDALSSQESKSETDDEKNDTEKTVAKKKKGEEDSILGNPVANPIWLSVSEAAKIGGVNTKTIRRAIQSEKVKYKIYKDRYLIGLRSLIIYLNSNKKLKNKLNFNGIGQYVKEWRGQ